MKIDKILALIGPGEITMVAFAYAMKDPQSLLEQPPQKPVKPLDQSPAPTEALSSL